MIVIGIALVFTGYTCGMWGYCLIKGYNISFSQLISPSGYYKGTWPPPLITDTSVLLPTGASSSSSLTAAGADVISGLTTAETSKGSAALTALSPGGGASGGPAPRAE